jgi:glycosyltransferase involved in cell wall biosynthesis
LCTISTRIRRRDSGNVSAIGIDPVRIALLTNYLAGYRRPLYERLAARYGVEVLCYGGGERYAPPWIAHELGAQIADASFPAAVLEGGARAALDVAARYDALIAPYAGGAVLPAAYGGAVRYAKPFVLWASVWAQPLSATNLLALPVTRHIYRHADAVLAYGEHVRAFVASIRGRDEDVFVAPQSVEPELFGVRINAAEVSAFKHRHGLPEERPIVLYAGRLVPEKGVDVLLQAWARVAPQATLLVIGDGPLGSAVRGAPNTALVGAMERSALPVAYAAAAFTVLPSVPTPRFREPWGLVCNEAMHQGRPVLATTAVGAVAGGLVRDGVNGVVVAPGDAAALARAIERLLEDGELRAELGAAARKAVAVYNYDAMVTAFDRALAVATRRAPVTA